MIIKTAGQEGSWRFYDNAREVQSAGCKWSDVFQVEGMTDKECCGVSAEVDGTRFENNLDYDQPMTSDAGCLMVSFINHEGMPHNLYVNRETYLLNDSGKTIERLF